MKAKYFVPILSVFGASILFAHGDVTPQAMNTDALPDIGKEWLEENPWRDPDSEYWATAIEIGDSGYNQNCARCHGLEVISGGLAPDLRYLSADYDGDEWYLERYRHGMTQNGTTKMPAFGEVLGQKAAWAIRTYIETRPDDGALDESNARLVEIRDILIAHADEIANGADFAEFTEQAVGFRTELETISAQIETGSGAPMSESVVSRAAIALDDTEDSFRHAGEILTVGLSAAQ